MAKKKTHEEYVEELKLKNANIEVIGRYINTYTKILHRCKIDGYEWMSRPNSILCGKSCPMCYGNIKKTHEQYVMEAAKVNPYIEVVVEYINAQTKILHRCKIDGYEWYIAPTTILNNHGCPICGNAIKRTHDEYIIEVNKINSNIEVVGEYINAQTKILHRCKIDGYEWCATPDSILRDHGCPVCSRLNAAQKRTRTHEEYVKEVDEIDKNIEVVGEYINAITPILHKCKIDKHEWNARPSTILRSHGCPKCNESKGEKTISAWLDKKNILYKRQKTFDDCKDKYVLRFDFYLSDYNICIEYNGRQHYEPVDYFGGQEEFEGIVNRDKIKKDYCKKNNILLIDIPYFADIYE